MALIRYIEEPVAAVSGGPSMNVGLTTTSSVSPPSARMKSHAARSAIVLERGYGGRPGMSGSVQSSSVNSRARLGGVADRGEGRGEHHPPGARVARGAQHAQGALPSGDDQLVGILRLGGRDGRGDVVDLVDPGHDGLPAVVGHQVGRNDLEAGVVRVSAAHRGAQAVLAGGLAHLGAHRLLPAAASSAATRCVPTYPDAPVTRILLIA